MPRYFFELSYAGKAYHGWQKQPGSQTVQGEIESVLNTLFPSSSLQVTGCGRTDTGVHAKHYFLHVDFAVSIDENDTKYRLNKMLPDDIAIHQIVEVDNEKHARFSARERTYRYFIHKQKDPFQKDYSLYFPYPLDLDKMNEACQYLIGRQEFTSFSKLHTDVKTDYCVVSEAKWLQTGPNELYFEIKADRFLRNMVRAIVGTLLDVGQGKHQVSDFKKILSARDRSEASRSAPAHGLHLWKISY